MVKAAFKFNFKKRMIIFFERKTSLKRMIVIQVIIQFICYIYFIDLNRAKGGKESLFLFSGRSKGSGKDGKPDSWFLFDLYKRKKIW